MTKVIFIAAVTTVLAVWTFQSFFASKAPSSFSFGYQFIVEMETPQGPATGNSVHRFDVVDNTNTPAGNFSSHFRGEAVFLELPGDLNLIVTLSREKSQHQSEMLYFLYDVYKLTGQDSSPGYRKYEEPFELTVPVSMYPIFAVVDKDGSRSSYREMSPESISTVLGSGYSIKKISLISTDLPPTSTISDHLPWFPEPGPSWQEGPRSSGGHTMSNLRIE